jgi:hypothetical protein
MKKIALLFALLFVVAFVYVGFSSNNYKEARVAADAGYYVEFYTIIKDDVASGKEDAKNVLMEYVLRAIDKGNFEELKYYMSQNPKLINEEDQNGTRPIEAVLVTPKYKSVNLAMLDLLLSYHPNLNYNVKQSDDMSIAQILAVRDDLNSKQQVVDLLVKHGLDIDLHDAACDGRAKSVPPLTYAYLDGNIDFFDVAIKYAKDMNPKNNDGSLLDAILNSYITMIKEQNPEYQFDINRFSKDEADELLRSERYRALHRKNMQFLESLFKNNITDKIKEEELRKLVEFYAITGESDALMLMHQNGLSKFQRVCRDAKQKAIDNKNYSLVVSLGSL